MRKFLSLFTAMLVAIAVSADPVVLPATLDVNNVSFRSEGMPDFVLAEGDYAGTYFDMGAHDSANDTLLYAQWDVTIEPIMYTVGVVVYNTNSWRVQLDLLNQSDEVVKAIRYKGSSGQCGQYGIGTLDLTDLAAGNYKVRVHAATAWSAMKLKDVIFVANYAGANVDLPGTLLPAYAELSSGATVSNNAIAFAPSTANNEFATWNVTFAEAGNFDVTIDMTASNGHTYGVALLSADGATEIGAVAEEQAWDTGVKALGSIAVPAAGSYKVKLTNATQWSEALLNSITFAAPAPAHTYTVAGSSEVAFGTIWASANTANDMEMNDDGIYVWERTELTLPAGSIEFKVCEDHGWDVAYPGSNYQLAIPEAGIYTIWIHFDPANGNQVTAGAIKTGDAVVIPTIAMHGNFTGSWADTENFTIAEGNATAALTLELAAGNYEFGMRIGGSGNWTANGAAFTRENPSAVIAAGSGNLTLAADAAGEYTFTWTYETNTLAITFPAQEEELSGVIYDWAGEIGTTIFGGNSNIATGTVKIHENTDNVNGIKFGSSYVYADGKWIAIKPVKGGFKAGDVLSVSVVFNNSDATKYCMADVYAADGATRMFRSDSASTLNGRNAGEPMVQTYTLASDQDSLFLGRYGNTGMFITLLKVERAGTTPEEPAKFYITGDAATVGESLAWNPAAIKVTEDSYTLALAAGDYKLKVTVDGTWETAKGFNDLTTTADGLSADGDGNICFTLAEAGDVVVTYTAEAFTLAGNFYVEPQPTKYCEFATGHLKDPNFGDANGRILLTIQKIADSNNIRVAIKNNAAAGNTKAGLNYLWVNATGAKNNNATYGSHEAEDVEEVSVIVEFDEAQESYVFNNIHWAYAGWGGEWAIDGLTVSAAELCEASTPVVELNYYMKNNWDAGADWTWKAMTKDGETYKLEKVVFGGTGVNYNTAESDEGSSWVPVANIAGDAISAKDTVTLVLDPVAGTVTATLIGKYVDPNPGEHTYTVAGSSEAAFGTAWDPENAHNDMVLNGVGIYLWEKTELTLPEGTIKFKVCEDHAWDVAYPAQDYELAITETGVYTIYIAFNPETKEVNATATKTGDATVTVDYYLVGSAKGWEAKAENIFTLNAEAGEGIEEYKIETTLEVGEGLKVLSSTGVWYPDGMGNEYVVDQDHAGATTIYFRPAGNAEWAAFGGYMYVVPTGGAGIDAIDANAPAVKVLHNGQILIKKGDKTYNIMGAIVR